MTASRHLAQGLFGAAAVRAVDRLPLAGLGNLETSVIRLCAGALGLVPQDAGALDRVVPTALRTGQLALQAHALILGGDGALPERGDLAFEGGSFALERAQGLRVRLEGLLPLTHLCALLGEPPAHVLVGIRAAGQLGADPFVLDPGRLVIAGGGVTLEECLPGPDLHLTALVLRPEPPGGGVREPFAGERQVAVELAELDPRGPE
ncbi:MAG: hypothetical protein H0T86_08970, partial [Gemmatimonadales bacterium]|nr:hypothetical protein [Gemmatimonadales bacterium]